MTGDNMDLDRAYALETPEDSKALYRDWADTYDSSFAEHMDYIYPAAVAAVFAARAGRDVGPVLDVGAGTGLVGEALARLGRWDVDGLDISEQMLAVAMGKGHYRAVIPADLTRSLDIASGTYGAVISAGTFTHGHVGPEALDELLRIAKPTALFVLGINEEVYQANGFEQKFAALAPVITGFEILKKRIYGEDAPEEHRNDQTCIAVFRKI